MLQELADRLISQIGVEKSALEERAEELKRDRALFEDEKAKMSAFADHQQASQDIVEINVGGEVMASKRGTLLLAKNTLLEAIFSGRWESSLERDAAGRVFLDFSPVPFRALLSHLRVLRDAGPETRVKFAGVPPEYQAEFDSMVKYLELWEFLYGKATCSHGALECHTTTQQHPGLRVEATDKGGSAITVLGDSSGLRVPLVGSHALLDMLDQAWWKISIDKLPAGSCLLAGVVAGEVMQDMAFLDETSYGLTSYGWASTCIFQRGRAAQGGKNVQGSRGWTTWQQGDVAIFRLDARSSQLCMCLMRTGGSHSYSLKLHEEMQVHEMRLHLNVQAPQGLQVELLVLPVTSAEAVNLCAASRCSF